MSNEEFDSHIIKKYGSIPVAQSTIVEYKDVLGNYVSLDTYNYYALISSSMVSNFTPVYAIDKEFELNEQKRNIQLIDRVYSTKIASELEQSLA